MKNIVSSMYKTSAQKDRVKPTSKMDIGGIGINHGGDRGTRGTRVAIMQCNNAANMEERKIWTQSEFCTLQSSVRGQEPPSKL